MMRSHGCRLWVKGCRCYDVGITTGVPQIAVDSLQSPRRHAYVASTIGRSNPGIRNFPHAAGRPVTKPHSPVVEQRQNASGLPPGVAGHFQVRCYPGSCPRAMRYSAMPRSSSISIPRRCNEAAARQENVSRDHLIKTPDALHEVAGGHAERLQRLEVGRRDRFIADGPGQRLGQFNEWVGMSSPDF
jgi:hypothetical protein